jgi:hypothetical protein
VIAGKDTFAREVYNKTDEKDRKETENARKRNA